MENWKPPSSEDEDDEEGDEVDDLEIEKKGII